LPAAGKALPWLVTGDDGDGDAVFRGAGGAFLRAVTTAEATVTGAPNAAAAGAAPGTALDEALGTGEGPGAVLAQAVTAAAAVRHP
jgi:hypothetical protein